MADLSLKKQIAFCLLIFERMFPALTAFSAATGRNLSCYLAARDGAWRALRNGQDTSMYIALNDQCLKQAPDTEEFSHKLTSYALNAALAMSDILELIVDHRVDHATHVTTLATDSVFLYLGVSNALPPNDGVKDLLREELRRQKEDFQFLSTLPDYLDDQTIAAIKSRAIAQVPLPPIPAN